MIINALEPKIHNIINIVDELELSYHNSLIEHVEFKHDNPFDLPFEIIDYNSKLPDFILKEFKTNAYKNWIEMMYAGEALVIDSYRGVYNIIKNGNYAIFQNLNYNEEFDFFNFFEETISEETKHTNMLEFFVHTSKYNIEIIDKDAITKNTEYAQKVNELISEKNILQTLFNLYMGEVAIVVSVSLILKYSTNDNKKKFLKTILQEESKHVNGFLKLIKLIKKNITQDELESLDVNFKTKTLCFEYFGLYNSYGFFECCSNNLLKFMQCSKNQLVANFIESITKNKFQQEFNALWKKKFFLYYQVLFPNITESEYNAKIDNSLNLYLKFENDT